MGRKLLPEFRCIFLLDFTPLIDKMTVLLQEFNAFLSVHSNAVILVL